ncbi:MAG: HEPN domain-containing protein [Candidatus Aenigmatarchaeota archaeon]
MKKEIIEKVKLWINKAEKDIKLAKLALDNDIFDYSLFHSQQAIEKFLKAFLVFHNKPLRKTHDIEKLIEMCKEIDAEFEKLYDMNIEKFYPIGIEVRYPEFEIEISEQEAKEAVEIAEKVKEFVMKKLEKLE